MLLYVRHHRQKVVELRVSMGAASNIALYDPALELAFSREILALDVKNYHGWTYR